MTEKQKPAWLEEFIEYLINPYDNRTYEKVAADFGITYQTLWRARREWEDYIQAAVKAGKQRTYDAIRPNALKALSARIKSSDAALKLYFQLVGDLVERTETRTEILTPEDKRRRISELLSGIALNRSTLPQDESKGQNG